MEYLESNVLLITCIYVDNFIFKEIDNVIGYLFHAIILYNRFHLK